LPPIARWAAVGNSCTHDQGGSALECPVTRQLERRSPDEVDARRLYGRAGALRQRYLAMRLGEPPVSDIRYITSPRAAITSGNPMPNAFVDTTFAVSGSAHPSIRKISFRPNVLFPTHRVPVSENAQSASTPGRVTRMRRAGSTENR